MVRHGGVALVALAVAFSAFGEVVRLSDGRLALGFDSESSYALTEIGNVPRQVQFLGPEPTPAGRERGLWKIVLRAPDGTTAEVYPADAANTEASVDDNELLLVWSGISATEVESDLNVRATVRVVPGTGRSEWRLEVSGRSGGAIWEVEFPRVRGMAGMTDDQIAVPQYLGRLVRSPARQRLLYRLAYPQPASMQYFAYWGTPDAREPVLPDVSEGIAETGWAPDRSDAAGLYWAAEDGAGWFKQFNLATHPDSGEFEWSITHYPGLASWPLDASGFPSDVSYRVPYPVVITAFTGDYHEAAALYRDWASGQVWCRRGPLASLPEVPPAPGSDALALWTPAWFRTIGFWAKFYHEPAKILPEWAAYRQWLRVPMASHYYRYNIARFDDNYPEALPGDPYLLEGIRAARQLGVRPLPYINGVIWDSDTQSWIRENGFASSIKSESGEFVPWDIHGEIFAHMCPATEQWRAKMRETCRKLICEHGMAGVYLDCLAATGARPCYDITHGHTARGGNYRAAGNRKLMFDLRRDSRQLDPDASFFTEEIGEQYIDVMDGFLTLDFSRSGSQAGERVFPVFSTVYHPYTINFGSDAKIDASETQFALEYGLLFLWGCQPLVSAIVAVPPRDGDANSAFLREVTQAYYTAGKAFLQDGRWERIAVVPPDAPASKCGLELRAEAVAMPYEKRRFQRTWCGPAVPATAWRNGDDLGVVMVNLTDRPRRVTLSLDATKLFGADAERVRGLCLWPEVAAIGIEPGREITLPPRSARIEAFGPEPDRFRDRLRPLDDVREVLVTADQGKPFDALIRPAGELWACSDSAVHVRKTDAPGQISIEPVLVENGRAVGVRRGRQTETTGPRAEGRGLPREAADQPFMVLRRLPYRLIDAQEGGECIVFGAGEGYLDMRMEGGGTIVFDRPGIVVLRGLASGKMLRGIDAGPADRVTAPAGACLIAYVSDLSALAAAVVSEAAGVDCAAEQAQDLAAALSRLESEPGHEALADATRCAVACLLACAEAPGLVAPERPLIKLIERLNGLVTAQCGTTARIELDNDWLSPGIEKQVDVLTELLGAGAVTPRNVTFHAVLGNESERIQFTPGIGTASEGRIATDWTLLLRDGLYIERVVPIAAVVPLADRLHLYRLVALDWLEANRPFEIRAQSDAVTAVAGQGGAGEVALRNWSPHPLRVALAASGPAGWRPVCDPAVVDIPPFADGKVRVQIGAPDTANAGVHSVRVDANHSAIEQSGVTSFLTALLLDALVPVEPAAYRDAGPVEDAPPQLRQNGMLAFYAEKGAHLTLTLENVRVTRYVDTMDFRLLDPALKPIEDGRIPVDQQRVIELAAPVTGTYYVEVSPKSGSCRALLSGAVLSEVASHSHPLQLFCSAVTRTFYVAAGARSFVFGATDGGPTETARVVLRSPNGRVALDRDGNWGGADLTIDVLQGEDAGIWTLECLPRQDVSLWLGGGATPCLAPVPGGVLRGRR